MVAARAETTHSKHSKGLTDLMQSTRRRRIRCIRPFDRSERMSSMHSMHSERTPVQRAGAHHAMAATAERAVARHDWRPRHGPEPTARRSSDGAPCIHGARVSGTGRGRKQAGWSTGSPGLAHRPRSRSGSDRVTSSSTARTRRRARARRYGLPVCVRDRGCWARPWRCVDGGALNSVT